MDLYRDHAYDNCCRAVYDLLIDNKADECKRKYSKIKDYVPLFQIMNEIIKNSHAHYIDWNDYQTVINASDELMPFYKNIVEEKEFLEGQILANNMRLSRRYFCRSLLNCHLREGFLDPLIPCLL